MWCCIKKPEKKRQEAPQIDPNAQYENEKYENVVSYLAEVFEKMPYSMRMAQVDLFGIARSQAIKQRKNINLNKLQDEQQNQDSMQIVDKSIEIYDSKNERRKSDESFGNLPMSKSIIIPDTIDIKKRRSVEVTKRNSNCNAGFVGLQRVGQRFSVQSDGTFEQQVPVHDVMKKNVLNAFQTGNLTIKKIDPENRSSFHGIKEKLSEYKQSQDNENLENSESMKYYGKIVNNIRISKKQNKLELNLDGIMINNVQTPQQIRIEKLLIDPVLHEMSQMCITKRKTLNASEEVFMEKHIGYAAVKKIIQEKLRRDDILQASQVTVSTQSSGHVITNKTQTQQQQNSQQSQNQIQKPAREINLQ